MFGYLEKGNKCCLVNYMHDFYDMESQNHRSSVKKSIEKNINLETNISKVLKIK